MEIDGWKGGNMTNSISNGSKGLESLDPFDSIDSCEESTSVFKTSMRLDAHVENFVTPKDC